MHVVPVMGTAAIALMIVRSWHRADIIVTRWAIGKNSRCGIRQIAYHVRRPCRNSPAGTRKYGPHAGAADDGRFGLRDLSVLRNGP